MQSYLAEKPPTSGHEDQKEKAGGAACSVQTSSLKPITAAITTPNFGPFQDLYELDPSGLTGPTSSRFRGLLARKRQSDRRYRERIKMEKMEMGLKVGTLQAENDRLMRLNLELQKKLSLPSKAAFENLQNEKDAFELKPRTGGNEGEKAGTACSIQPFARPVNPSNDAFGRLQAVYHLDPTRLRGATSLAVWGSERAREIRRKFIESRRKRRIKLVDILPPGNDSLQVENDHLVRSNHQLLGNLPLLDKASLENDAPLQLEEAASQVAYQKPKALFQTLSDHFWKLEELVIEDCPEVTSLVISRDEGTPSSASVYSIAVYLLPSLKRMSLLFLPKLDRMSNGLLITPRLEKVGIYYCRQLRNISTIETSSQELNVKGEVTWWNALEWENQQLRSRIKFKEIERKRDLISQLVDDKFIVLAYKQEC